MLELVIYLGQKLYLLYYISLYPIDLMYCCMVNIVAQTEQTLEQSILLHIFYCFHK